MSWAGVIAAIDAHLVAAGASLTPSVTAVRQGEPDAVTVPVFAYWYAGDRESETGGNTFGVTNLEEAVAVRGYFPGTVRAKSQDATLEVLIQAAKAAIRSALWADALLGGNAIGIDITPTQSGWTQVGDALARSFEFTVWVDLAGVDDITPP